MMLMMMTMMMMIIMMLEFDSLRFFAWTVVLTELLRVSFA